MIEYLAVYKNQYFVAVYFLCTILQFWRPHHRDWRNDFRNAALNLLLAVMNAGLVAVLLGGTVLNIVSQAQTAGFGLIPWLTSHGVAGGELVAKGLIAQTTVSWWLILVSVLVLDFTAYAWHIANHRWSYLWRLHQVHHSDLNFDVSTALRFHFGEVLISLVVRLAVILLLGLPLEGLLVFELVYQTQNFFEHSNLALPAWFERAWGQLFITPALHRKHHSQLREDLDRNFGTVFSFWDRLFTTYKAGHSTEHYAVGLPKQSENFGLKQLLLLPFTKSS